MTAKPKRNYIPTPFHFYRPSDEELNKLVMAIQGHTGKALQENEEFKETIRRLLILIRKKVDTQQTAPTKEAQYVELRQLKTSLQSVERNLSYEGISPPLWNRIINLMVVNKLANESDPIAGLRLHTNNLLWICEKIEKDFIDEPDAEKKPPTLADARDMVAEELARALDKAGYKPTATRGGFFEKCFEAFMEAIACTVEGRKVRIKPLAEPYAVIRRAIRSYPEKPIYPLLEVKKFPGLTG